MQFTLNKICQSDYYVQAKREKEPHRERVFMGKTFHLRFDLSSCAKLARKLCVIPVLLQTALTYCKPVHGHASTQVFDGEGKERMSGVYFNLLLNHSPKMVGF